MRTLCIILASLLVALLGGTAAGQSQQDKTTARNLFFEARDAYEDGQFQKAADLFERANKIFPAPTTALGLARSLARAGQLVRAYETYNTVASAKLPPDASAPFTRAVATAAEERDELGPRLPALVIHVAGPAEPVVDIDGQAVDPAALGVKRFVDPGERVVRASGAGYALETQRVDIEEGATITVRFALRELPEPVPGTAGMSTLTTAGVVATAIGGASLLAAIISGGVYLSEKSTVDEHCQEIGPRQFDCADAAGAEAVSAGRTAGWVNTFTLIGGLAAAGVGVTFLLLGDDGGDDELALRAGPGQLSLEVTF